jgi:hypothetical protein
MILIKMCVLYSPKDAIPIVYVCTLVFLPYKSLERCVCVCVCRCVGVGVNRCVGVGVYRCVCVCSCPLVLGVLLPGYLLIHCCTISLALAVCVCVCVCVDSQ